jgi:hypothetical protein
MTSLKCGTMRTTLDAVLLEPCRTWLGRFLGEKYPKSNVMVLPKTERLQLRHVLVDAGLDSEFPESSAWEVRVDVVGVISRRGLRNLAFVELKATPISLVNIGQLLGYCRVCRPAGAFLLSPAGLSTDLARLLTDYGRTDILTFGRSVIHVGRWDAIRRQPDWASVIPSGVLQSLHP